MSAVATSAAISSWVARVAPWWTVTRMSGVNLWASARQFPTTAGGAITSVGPCSRVATTWASTVGVLPRPMSRARQPPRPAESQNRSQPSAAFW